jgi:nitrogen regulatory protein PII
VNRRTDPKKEIEKALREAELAGLTVTDSSGHGHSTLVISGD